MSFPVVSIKDFVRVQKALIDSLGIKKLKAVMGASMGGLQAYEWAQSYPDTVERIIPVIASASAEPFLIAWLDTWAQPIRLDPKWNNGDYYDKEPPTEGLKAALKIVTLQANSWEWARKAFGTAPAEDGKDPAKAFSNQFKIESFLDQAATARAGVSDANHFLYLCKANQVASVDPTKIKVPTLVLYAPNDLIFYEPIVEDTISKDRRRRDIGRKRDVARTERPFQWDCADRAGTGQDQRIPRQITQMAGRDEQGVALAR